MNKPSPAPEPSMEEILASIRRIISDGEDPVAGPQSPDHQDNQPEPEAEAETASQKAPADEEAGEEDDNILDLTEEMFVGGRDAEAPPAKEQAPAAAMPLVNAPEPDVVFDEAKARPEPEAPRREEAAASPMPAEPAPAPNAPEPAPKAPEPAAKAPEQAASPPEPGPRISTEPGAAVETLISPATDATVAAAFGQLATNMLGQDSRTIEDLVSELLRPMLREWLDDNLPSLVERLVRAEIERVSRGR